MTPPSHVLGSLSGAHPSRSPGHLTRVPAPGDAQPKPTQQRRDDVTVHHARVPNGRSRRVDDVAATPPPRRCHLGAIRSVGRFTTPAARPRSGGSPCRSARSARPERWRLTAQGRAGVVCRRSPPYVFNVFRASSDGRSLNVREASGTRAASCRGRADVSSARKNKARRHEVARPFCATRARSGFEPPPQTRHSVPDASPPKVHPRHHAQGPSLAR